jgi:hypothetical protein
VGAAPPFLIHSTARNKHLPAWIRAEKPGLTQGTYLPNCLVPVLGPDFDPQLFLGDGAKPVIVEQQPQSKRLFSRLLSKWAREPRETTRPVDPAIYPLQIDEFDLIVMTQSCDLEQDKVRKIALCAIAPIDEFDKVNVDFKKKKWPEVRRGRMYGLYALPPLPDSPAHDGLIVDFREIYSLPLSYIARHAATLTTCWQLRSPDLEAFSHAFGEFFSRVAKDSYL